MAASQPSVLSEKSANDLFRGIQSRKVTVRVIDEPATGPKIDLPMYTDSKKTIPITINFDAQTKTVEISNSTAQTLTLLGLNEYSTAEALVKGAATVVAPELRLLAERIRESNVVLKPYRSIQKSTIILKVPVDYVSAWSTVILFMDLLVNPQDNVKKIQLASLGFLYALYYLVLPIKQHHHLARSIANIARAVGFKAETQRQDKIMPEDQLQLYRHMLTFFWFKGNLNHYERVFKKRMEAFSALNGTMSADFMIQESAMTHIMSGLNLAPDAKTQIVLGAFFPNQNDISIMTTYNLCKEPGMSSFKLALDFWRGTPTLAHAIILVLEEGTVLNEIQEEIDKSAEPFAKIFPVAFGFKPPQTSKYCHLLECAIYRKKKKFPDSTWEDYTINTPDPLPIDLKDMALVDVAVKKKDDLQSHMKLPSREYTAAFALYLSDRGQKKEDKLSTN